MLSDRQTTNKTQNIEEISESESVIEKIKEE
jgi:hypothetical protein